jgi:hypothetical protein
MWDKARDENFHWDHERDGRCAATLDNNGHPLRCDGEVASSGWWWFIYPAPGHWQVYDACQAHRRFLVDRPWRVSSERPWVPPVN